MRRSHLYGQGKVLLNELVVVFGPVADSIVYFEHAGVAGYQKVRLTRMQLGPESPPVHPLPKVGLFSDDADRLVLSKALVRQEILFEYQPGALDILFFTPHLNRGS